ncbi:hypothetical protein ABZ616_06360 [Streptomyces noursei]|uniref:hypothetical protein n=1 Tax=Streptomyces noursei TaxID=1971 RepID=UPI0033D60A8F
MTRTEPVAAARGLAQHLFPDALTVLVGGSVPTERRTRTSDLDMVVVTGAELEAHRHELTDLLDDLAGADDPAELAFIASRVLNKTALLALPAGRHWQGSGKWLLRELRDHDPVLADRLAHSLTAPPRLSGVAREVLDGAGGPLRGGYRVTDPRRP